MRQASVRWTAKGTEVSGLDVLILQIGRLLRHPAYRREAVVSPLLRRHLPYEAGYAWRGEVGLRERLAGAGLDAASLDHLIGNVRAEFARLRGPGDA